MSFCNAVVKLPFTLLEKRRMLMLVVDTAAMFTTYSTLNDSRGKKLY